MGVSLHSRLLLLVVVASLEPTSGWRKVLPREAPSAVRRRRKPAPPGQQVFMFANDIELPTHCTRAVYILSISKRKINIVQIYIPQDRSPKGLGRPVRTALPRYCMRGHTGGQRGATGHTRYSSLGVRCGFAMVYASSASPPPFGLARTIARISGRRLPPNHSSLGCE
jgi:hypothetical protein